jgi:glutathione S-transferase
MCFALNKALTPSTMPTSAPATRAKKRPPAAPVRARKPSSAASTRVKSPAVVAKGRRAPKVATRTTLTLSSKNYSSWSMRGWLLARFAGIDFDEVMVSPDDADVRKELLLLAPSIRVPCLSHEGATVWNTLAIAQYLNEVSPSAGLMPSDRIARAHCRSVSGEMNSGFANLRASLPMNLKAHYPKHRIWGGAKPDIERVVEIWTDCLATYGGPFLFGKQRGMADAMYAPVVTRFLTYDVPLDAACKRYCETIMAMPEMLEWVAAAQAEPDDIAELDMEF